MCGYYIHYTHNNQISPRSTTILKCNVPSNHVLLIGFNIIKK